jgi:hypothetical protein
VVLVLPVRRREISRNDRSRAVDERGMATQRELELEVEFASADATGCSGTMQLRCDACGREEGRSFACASRCRKCPWQTGRVAPVLDILPRVPVRHVVVTLPEPWRRTLAHAPAALRRVRNAFMREVIAMVGAASAITGGHGGAVCATHPCGSCLDLNVHLHALVLDGVYTVSDGEPTFHPLLDDPDPRALRVLAQRLYARLESIAPGHAAPEAVRRERPVRRLALTSRLALGPATRAATPNQATSSTRRRTARIADVAGVHVRAGHVVDASDREALARLAGYLTRPIAAAHAFTPGSGETIRYRLLRPFADGTTHVEFAPAELATRLQALGPHGPSPRITWHGVLAPHAAARRHVVPRQLELGHVLGHVDAPARPRTRTLRRPRSLPPPREPPCPDCGVPMQLVAVDALP